MLSIHPQYVKRIKEGTKRFEFRRRLPKYRVNEIFIYETAPLMKVVAVVQVNGEIIDSPSVVWEKTKNFAGISRIDFENYFKGQDKAFAYELGTVKIFEEGKDLTIFGLTCAPQSFVYIDHVNWEKWE